jgi:hypothetical protein
VPLDPDRFFERRGYGVSCCALCLQGKPASRRAPRDCPSSAIRAAATRPRAFIFDKGRCPSSVLETKSSPQCSGRLGSFYRAHPKPELCAPVQNRAEPPHYPPCPDLCRYPDRQSAGCALFRNRVQNGRPGRAMRPRRRRTCPRPGGKSQHVWRKGSLSKGARACRSNRQSSRNGIKPANVRPALILAGRIWGRQVRRHQSRCRTPETADMPDRYGWQTDHTRKRAEVFPGMYQKSACRKRDRAVRPVRAELRRRSAGYGLLHAGEYRGIPRSCPSSVYTPVGVMITVVKSGSQSAISNRSGAISGNSLQFDLALGSIACGYRSLQARGRIFPGEGRMLRPFR